VTAICWRAGSVRGGRHHVSIMMREGQDLLFRAFCGLGVLLGLTWGLHHQPTTTCAHSRAPAAIPNCATHILSVIGVHWGISVGAGLLLGALIGAMVTRTLRLLAA
jgi:hypothetical protein